MSVQPVHTFDVAYQWDYQAGAGLARAGNREPITLSPPPEFGGKDSNWSPEHLLAASLASCYTNTFMHFAKLLGVHIAGFSIDARAEFEKGKTGFEATRYVLEPVVKFVDIPDESVIIDLFSKAKKYCFISNSVKGDIVVESHVLAR